MKKKKNMDEIISHIKDMTEYPKLYLAQVFDGKSESSLQKLLDANCTVDIPIIGGGTYRIEMLAVLLQNKKIKGKMRDKLIKACENSQNEEVKLELAKDSRTPLRIQKKLALDKNGDIRVELAWRKKPHNVILKILAKDKNWAVRREVAKSKHSKAKILELFLDETDNDVVLDVLKNKNMTLNLVNKFVDKFINQDGWIGEDGEYFEKGWNYHFFNIAIHIILTFEKQKNLKNNKLFNYIAEQDEELYRVLLAKRDSIPTNIFEKLYRDDDTITPTYFVKSQNSTEKLLLRIAKNKLTDPINLIFLSNTHFKSVKLSLIENSNTPEIVLQKYQLDEIEEISDAASDKLFERGCKN